MLGQVSMGYVLHLGGHHDEPIYASTNLYMRVFSREWILMPENIGGCLKELNFVTKLHRHFRTP